MLEKKLGVAATLDQPIRVLRGLSVLTGDFMDSSRYIVSQLPP